MAPRCVVFDGLAVITGGQVTRAKAFLQRLRKYDPHSKVIVLNTYGDWVPTGCQSDIEIIEVSLPRARFRAAGRMVWQNFCLPRLLDRVGAEVYLTFSHYLPPTIPVRLLTIMGVSNFAPFSDLAMRAEVSMPGKLRLRMLRKTILGSAQRAHHVIALSGALKKELVREGIDENKVVVIPNGVEQPAADDVSGGVSRHGIRGEFLLYVSHFYRYKNFERLVKAYAFLSPELRRRFTLVLVGRPFDRRYCDEIETLVRELKLRDHVVIIPGLPDHELSAFYKNARLFLFPSLAENSPNALLEAMVHGIPTLASRIPPMPEFGGSAVRYMDPLDVEAMTKEITALLDSPTDMEVMGQRARAQAQSFTWDHFTAAVVDLYHRGMPHKPSGLSVA